jgi:hypothetical protein
MDYQKEIFVGLVRFLMKWADLDFGIAPIIKKAGDFSSAFKAILKSALSDFNISTCV